MTLQRTRKPPRDHKQIRIKEAEAGTVLANAKLQLDAEKKFRVRTISTPYLEAAGR